MSELQIRYPGEGEAWRHLIGFEPTRTDPVMVAAAAFLRAAGTGHVELRIWEPGRGATWQWCEHAGWQMLDARQRRVQA